jgi:hypothetical protein
MPRARACGTSSRRAARSARRKRSALIARRTYSLLVTPSGLAIFSRSRRNRFGKLIVSVSLICTTPVAITWSPEANSPTRDSKKISYAPDWVAVAAATWFESLAVASRPLQRRPAETNFSFKLDQSRTLGDDNREQSPRSKSCLRELRKRHSEEKRGD